MARSKFAAELRTDVVALLVDQPDEALLTAPVTPPDRGAAGESYGGSEQEEPAHGQAAGLTGAAFGVP